jgi:hypothetical protein
LPPDIFGGAPTDTTAGLEAAVNSIGLSGTANGSTALQPPTAFIASDILLGAGTFLTDFNIAVGGARTP